MKKISILLLVILSFMACNDPYQNNIAPAYDSYPIVTMLESEPETFSLYLSLLKRADMYSTLNLNATYTCFVPTNDAITKYLGNKGYASVEAIAVDDAKLLVKYHTIAGKEYTQSFFESGVIPDTTATGDYLSIAFREGGLSAIYVNGVSRINKLDIKAINGVVHSIDDVLIPVTETVWDMVNTNTYSLFAQAVELTGYAETLKKISETVVSETAGLSQRKKFYYTLFAVTDEVYKQKGINTFNELLAYLGTSDAESEYTNAENALNKYVAYHIIDQQMDYASLSTFSESTTSKNLSTLAVNELINLTTAQNRLAINYDEVADAGIFITNENVNAKNGILHIIDDPMPVKVPPQLTVIWELTDYADLAGLFPNEYRQSNLSSTATKQISEGSTSCYNWSSSVYLVSYNVYNKLDARYAMLNNDCLAFNLGLYGWLEMQTPAIVKGKYSMKISYFSVAGSVKTGKFSLILDGNYVGGEISTHGSSSTTSRIVKSTVADITFDTTTAHKLRILQTDNSTVYVDYIEFVPVD